MLVPEGKECRVEDELVLPSAGPDPLPWDTALAAGWVPPTR